MNCRRMPHSSTSPACAALRSGYSDRSVFAAGSLLLVTSSANYVKSRPPNSPSDTRFSWSTSQLLFSALYASSVSPTASVRQTQACGSPALVKCSTRRPTRDVWRSGMSGSSARRYALPSPSPFLNVSTLSRPSSRVCLLKKNPNRHCTFCKIAFWHENKGTGLVVYNRKCFRCHPDVLHASGLSHAGLDDLAINETVQCCWSPTWQRSSWGSMV
jgi:hypothetical protein